MNYISHLEARSDAALFRPAALEPLHAPVDLLTTAKLMRENPIAILPDILFEKTRISGPYMGRSVHEVSGPEEMKSILQDNFLAWRKSPLILRMLQPILGDAILTAHDDSWKRQRRLLQPSFFKRRIDKFASVMFSAADEAVQHLSVQNQPVTTLPVMNDLTFSVIEKVIFTDIEGFDRSEVRAAIDILLEEIGRVRFSDLLPFPEWAPRMMTVQARRARRTFRQAVQAQIDRRHKQHEPGDDLLGLLISAYDEMSGETLTDSDVRDTVMTFIAAGHETTAIALTWALYLVANDQEVQDGVRTEARHVLLNGEKNADAVGRLVLSRMVVEEAMRLFPPAPILGRRAIQDTDICGHKVRKGDVALLAFYAQHRHQTLWDNPDLFDPLRWSESRRPQDRYAFMAFGGGPRACIGAQFAMMEAVAILSSLLLALDVKPAQGDATPIMQVTLRPKDGMPLTFKPFR